jgi:23S rRNA (uracil1939-C5)-methyltransferase
MDQEYEVTLTGMAFGGEAIGRLPDGRAVFVPFGLPGEKVRLALTEDKGSFAKGRITEVLEPSPQRIQPRCRHFGDCGGCSYQNLDYPSQLTLKRQIVVDQLQRLAGITDFPVAPVVPSTREWNYRNSVQFHVSPAGRLGFQRAASNNLVEISGCHLPAEEICALWPQLSLEPGLGIDRLQLRQGLDGDLILGLESRSDVLPDFSVDFPVSAVFLGADSQYVLSGDDFVLMQVKGRDFRVSIKSFFQVNIDQAARMVDHVLELAGDLKGKTVIDGYCGVGLFSAFLAGQVKRLIAIELSESSCNDFAVNLDEFDNVELYIDRVENVLPTLNLRAKVVLLDPPRAGLDARVIEALAKAKPQKIIYVSCDPATLARDIKRLTQQGFVLQSVTPFDQFPQTHHIETIVLLSISK